LFAPRPRRNVSPTKTEVTHMKSRTLSRLATLLALLGRGATPVDGSHWVSAPRKTIKGEDRGTQRRKAGQLAVC
jgi:hypothetical protein